MLGGSVNNITMIVVGLVLIFMIVVFGIYALLNNNNTETLEDSVRSALIANRDDSARVNSKSLYALDIDNFEKQVKDTRLQELKSHHLGKSGAQYKFYYLLQNGDTYNTTDYKTKGGAGLSTDKPTLIKGVTVDVSVSAKDVKNNPTGRSKAEHELKADSNTRRFSVTYLIDGGKVIEGKNGDEAIRIRPSYLQQHQQNSKDQKFNHSTMMNLTDY